MSFLSKWNGWRAGNWRKEFYTACIAGSYTGTSTSVVYMPLVGSTAESTSSTNENVNFVPPNNGRLVSISAYSNASVDPGSTVITLVHNGVGTIGTKTFNFTEGELNTFDFSTGLDSGVNYWNIADGTTLAVGINVTSSLDTVNFYLKFEIDK